MLAPKLTVLNEEWEEPHELWKMKLSIPAATETGARARARSYASRHSIWGGEPLGRVNKDRVEIKSVRETGTRWTPGGGFTLDHLDHFLTYATDISRQRRKNILDMGSLPVYIVKVTVSDIVTVR